MLCFSIVPHQKKTNSMIIVQKDVTVGVNTNKIFQIRRQHMFHGQFSQRVLIYMFELSEDALLEKCLHGKTQNQNEFFNGMIWQDVCVNAATFEMGVYDALSHFNLGNIETVNIYIYLYSKDYRSL